MTTAGTPGPAVTASPASAAEERRALRAARWLPAWMGSIRWRITVLYSSVLFGVAAVLVGVIYLGLRQSLADEEIYRKYTFVQPVPGGIVTGTGVVVDPYRQLEHEANTKAVESLRTYSFEALGVLFLLSLGIGWVVAGRVLRPIGHITDVAKEIQATDLSRRIDLEGPDDELHELADTFDDMLGRLDVAFESQRQFIHEASHELRNPLAVTRTNLEVALADPDASPDELRHTLEVVQRSSERMTRLVDDLLVYARKGSLSLDRETVDAASLVRDSVTEFRASAEAAGVELVAEAPTGLFVDGDRIALRQALANLLANALRVSPAGTTVRVRAGREGPWVWLSVEDQGPGIAAEDQERVFQRFWRGDPTEGRAEGRSGLGLTIVRQVAEAHGGEIRLRSEHGAGAAFALWLPATTAPPDRAP